MTFTGQWHVFCDVGDWMRGQGSVGYTTNPLPSLPAPYNGLPDNVWDMSPNVARVKYKKGMSRPRQRVTDVDEMDVWLNDYVAASAFGRVFAPENTLGSALTLGRLVILAHFNGVVTWRTFFTGMIDRVYVDPLTQQTRIHVVGFWQSRDTQISLPTLVNPFSYDVVKAAIDEVGFRNTNPAFSPGKPIWHISGDSFDGGHLDNMYLGGYSNGSYTGEDSYAYVFDQYTDATVRRIVEDVVNVEFGYFYEDATGKFQLLGRDVLYEYLAITTTIQASDMVGHDYQYGAGVVNDVKLSVVPRKVVTNQILWTSITQRRFTTGVSTFIIHTLGTDGRAVGLLDTPVAVGWVFKRVSNDAIVTVQVVLTQVGAGVEAQIINEIGEKVYLEIGAQLLGSALLVDVPTEIRVKDLPSIMRYGQRFLDYSQTLIDSAEKAVDVANYILALDSSPRGSITYFELQNNSTTIYNLQLSMPGKINIQLATLSHDQNYWVVGSEYDIDMAGRKIKSKHYVQPDHSGSFWLLDIPGYCELDSHTRLGY